MDISLGNLPVNSRAHDAHLRRPDHSFKDQDKPQGVEVGNAEWSRAGGLHLGQIRAFIAENIVDAIMEGSEVDSNNTPYPQPAANSPIGVVNQIVDAARRLLHYFEQSSSDAPETSPTEAVQNKLDTGFSRVEESLSQLTNVTEELLAELQAIRNAVDEQLQQPLNTEGNTSVSFSAAGHEAYNMKSRTSIEIKTQEGDIVTIDLAQRARYDSTSLATQSSGKSLFAHESRLRTDSQLHIRVKGDLNEEERKAIEDVVRNINQLTEDYSANDIGKALDLSDQINMNSEQLAMVSFDYRKSEHYRAARMYESTQQAVQDEPLSREAAPKPQELLAVLSDFVQKVRTVIEDMRVDTPIAEPRKVTTHLLEAIFAFKGTLNVGGQEAKEENRADLSQLDTFMEEVAAQEG
ncbi:MAG: hypothetical protein OEX00_07785 [Gammaproteobacteria bacterium]|nr:hypothetical protein [Gammaproteobacteria bacterium]MDH5692243.1 hypothetical protein [Gammaproteobacteria bacterium]